MNTSWGHVLGGEQGGAGHQLEQGWEGRAEEETEGRIPSLGHLEIKLAGKGGSEIESV